MYAAALALVRELDLDLKPYDGPPIDSGKWLPYIEELCARIANK